MPLHRRAWLQSLAAAIAGAAGLRALPARAAAAPSPPIVPPDPVPAARPGLALLQVWVDGTPYTRLRTGTPYAGPGQWETLGEVRSIHGPRAETIEVYSPGAWREKVYWEERLLDPNVTFDLKAAHRTIQDLVGKGEQRFYRTCVPSYRTPTSDVPAFWHFQGRCGAHFCGYCFQGAWSRVSIALTSQAFLEKASDESDGPPPYDPVSLAVTRTLYGVRRNRPPLIPEPRRPVSIGHYAPAVS